jgi:hypothetical protein
MKVEGRRWRIERGGERGGKEGEENGLFNARKMGRLSKERIEKGGESGGNDVRNMI